jgi:cytidyltransferase-like protein
MKNLLSFEQFIIAEAKNGERVAIFPGRFQPFHNGHIASLRRTAQVFQCKVIPVQILSKTDKSPFPDALLTKMGDAIAKEFEFIADYCLYPQDRKTVIPQMVKYIREEMGYEPVAMGCGSDRLKAYEPQIKYLNSEKSDVPVSEPFRLEMVDERAPGGPSGTKVREAILADDKKLFESLTPKSIHKYYNEMKKSLEG